MTKDVLIEFSSVRYNVDGEGIDNAGLESAKAADKTESVMQGVYYEKNKKYYLLYDEVMEGFKEPVKTKVKFGEDELEITRSGPVKVRMIFENGKKNVANYITPYGSIQLEINTKSISISNSPDNISISIEYSLESGDELISECNIMIRVRPI